jgi:hypothetical protein
VYGLRRQLDLELKAPTPSADCISKLIGQLQAYRLFRDSARWLGDGAFPWARSWARSRSKPFVALFIDENLLNPDEAAVRAGIIDAFSMLFKESGFEINAITSSDGVLPTDLESREIGESIVGIDRFFEDAFTTRICKVEWPDAGDGNGSRQWHFLSLPKKRLLHDYDAIFCEVDYRNRFAGPQIVQNLISYMERTAAASGKFQLPALIVLTHMDNFGHVQQCLNLGAHAFVNKQRIFQIPSRLQRALEDVRPAHGNQTPIKRERSGQHSNFRTLYSLRPDRMANLRSLDFKQRVVGGWSEERPLSANGARRRYRHLADFDAQDRDWIRSLPKADLHCHFGTSISLRTVEALAFNTCGHLFTNWTHADVDREMVPAGVGVLIKDICSIVKKAVFDIAQDQYGVGDKRRAEFFYRAMEKTLEPRGRTPAARIPGDPYKAHPAVPGWSICSIRVPCAGDLRRARGGTGWRGRDR